MELEHIKIIQKIIMETLTSAYDFLDDTSCHYRDTSYHEEIIPERAKEIKKMQ